MGLALFSIAYRFCKPKKIINSDFSKIRIEIINCSGIEKQARKTQDFLRNFGFDVYELRTGKQIIDRTTVIERVNPQLSNAMAVANIMSYQKKLGFLPISRKVLPEIQKDIDSLLYIEVTVVLGRDAEKFIKSVQLP
ncbi:MAG: LytR C-terminal domain-containing protein [candidate division WOR-3 bacterium]|nr:LytR C-terminal domain-containing protein [candidate division WOR-3 bacterium]